MKANKVNELFKEQVERKRKITIYIITIVIVLIGIIICSMLTYFSNKKQYIPYNEESNLDYKVYYKKNSFFDKTEIAANKQYISSLIDYINAHFKYNLNIENQNIDYKYQYVIEANVDVIDKDSKNSLYNYKEELYKEEKNTNATGIEINKKIDVYYNKYNEIANKFITSYDLDNAMATLYINMYVKVYGTCENVEDINNSSVVSINIPLTKKTMAIDLEYDLVDKNNQKFLECEKESFNYIYLIIDIILLIIDSILIYKLNNYINQTRSAISTYKKELKKILNNYKEFIQKVNNEIDLSKYQVVKIDSFTDMLEIREIIQSPILMLENKKENGVYFLIPTQTKLIYTYDLKVSDMKKKENENVDFNE